MKKLILAFSLLLAVPAGADRHPPSGNDTLKRVDIIITSTQILALHTTPVVVVPSQGADTFIVPVWVKAHKPAGTAYLNVAAGDDLAFSFDSGGNWAIIETTGLLNQAGAINWFVHGPNTASALFPQLGPFANAGEKLSIKLLGAVDTGDSPLYVSLYYYVFKTGPAF